MSDFIKPNFINNIFNNAFEGLVTSQASGEIITSAFYTSDNEAFITSTGKQFMVQEE